MRQRQSNFELLRIIAIFLVVSIHIVGEMIFVAFPEKMTWKYCAIIYSISHSGVPVFVMLTGYFIYNSEKKLSKRIKRLALPYLFYVCLFTVYLMIFLPEGKNLFYVIGRQIFVLFSNKSEYFSGQMWYLYILFAVILLSPYINILINHLDRKKHFRLILIFSALFFAIPTLNTLLEINLIFEYSSDELRKMFLVFITYYLVGAYFAKYDVKIKKSKSVSLFVGGTLIVFLLSYFWSVYHPGAEIIKVLTGSRLVNRQYIAKLNEGNGFTMGFMNYNSALILISACGLFLLFKGLKIKTSRIINYLASLTFGVYINHIFVRDLLYKYLLPPSEGVHGFSYVKVTLASIVLTFVFAIVLEAARRTLSKLIFTNLKKLKKSSDQVKSAES